MTSTFTFLCIRQQLFQLTHIKVLKSTPYTLLKKNKKTRQTIIKKHNQVSVVGQARCQKTSFLFQQGQQVAQK